MPAGGIGMPAAPAITRIAPVPAVAPAGLIGPNPDSKIIPVAFEAEPRPHRITDSEADERAVIARGDVVDVVGVVLRNVDHVLLRRNNPDVVALVVDLLLGSVDKGARGH